MDNQTSVFLGLAYSWSKASITLEDVQPLHGGVRIYLPGWTMSQMFITRLSPGGQETKYRIPLAWQKSEKDALCQLFIDQDFLTIQPEERPGLPDEARPTITLTNSKNERHSVAKWAGVADARFDTLYLALRALAERTTGYQPIPSKFKAWQKIGIVGGLVAGLLLTLLLAYGVSTAVVAAWWPERAWLLLGLLFLLFIGAPILIRSLVWRERKKSHADRLFTNFPMTLIIWFLFFAALIVCGEIVWVGIKTMWHDTLMTANDTVGYYSVFAYSALLALYFVAIETTLIGPRLLETVNERF